MPKMNDRERLADLEARQRKIADDILEARRALRGKYASIIADLEIEKLSEKDFRDILAQAIRVGGPACIAALKPLSLLQRAEPAKRP